ncbi:MAG: 2-oxo acid dehydrogenase subunit E2 [Mycobacterium sp.]
MSDMQVMITLPSLGEDVTEATISRWLVAVGDEIGVDEPLLEVATDKVDSEIPSPHAGTIVALLADEDDVVAVGADLVTIALTPLTGQDTSAPQPMPAAPIPESPLHDRDAAQPAPAAAPPSTRVAASGLVVETTHPENAPAAETHPSGAAAGTPQRLPRIRQIIAGRMMESLRSSAQLTSVVEVDVTAIARLRDATKAQFVDRTGTKLSFLPFFAKATIEALEDHPLLGATVNADCTEVTYPDEIHLGIAVDSPRGLMVPVIHRADTLSITDLARAIASLADKVRAGSIGADDLAGGTFTVTNTGSRGALFDTPILNAPQSGILGTGSIVDRVVPRPDVHGGSSIAVRSMVYLALTYDHRIVDGADAARFLGTIKRRLEGEFSLDEVFGTAVVPGSAERGPT